MAVPQSSIEAEEVAQFSKHAEDWWNPNGVFRPLHRLNPVRLGYIRDQVAAHFRIQGAPRHPLKGFRILDVGCGGGILTEPLARMGGSVTGLDASRESIKAAQAHAKEAHLAIRYRVGSTDDFDEGPFDIVTALEIVEHVADLGSFIEGLAKLLKPGGLLILSTLNRTAKSFLLGIGAAEYILRWVPQGTHQWRKFLKPSELSAALEDHKLKVSDISGLTFNPLRGAFQLNPADTSVNYLMTARRGARRKG